MARPVDDLLQTSADLKRTEALLLLAEAHDILESVPSDGFAPAEFERYASLRTDLEQLMDDIDS